MNKGEEGIKLLKGNNYEYIENARIKFCDSIIEIPSCRRYDWIMEYLKDYKVTHKVKEFLSSLY